MTTIKIDLSDDQAAALARKAVTQGLSLEAWFRMMAAEAIKMTAVAPRRSGFGLLAAYGPGPSDVDIDANRHDMFQGFAEDTP